MRIRVTAELQPELLDLLRSCNLEYQYAYTGHYGHDKPDTLVIRVECAAISLSDMERLQPWGSFVVCPCNDQTLELYTSLPDDINKCII